MDEVKGYWTRIFDRCAELIRERPELTGDKAYWIARRELDIQLLNQPPPPHTKGE